MIFLCYSTNSILYKHIHEISQGFNISKIYGKPRTSLFSYFSDVFKVKIFKNQIVFIYNTSLANLFSSLISRFRGSTIIFHLHDPKPHSGFLNPIIFLIQFFQIIFSKHIILFHPQLIKTTLRYYPFLSKKKLLVFPHGKPEFIPKRIDLNPYKINFGFFGRNMAYKNVNEFLHLSSKFPSHSFHIFGAGYKNLITLNENTRIIDRFIENDEYYSYLNEVDYVVLPYKDISFSGIVNDAISLQKQMIVSKFVLENFSHPLMILLSEFDNPVKHISFTISKGGWHEYSKNLNQLLK